MNTEAPDVTQLMAYEDGALGFLDQVHLFANLVRSGLVWQLQGHYGRTAQRMIDANLISKDGIVNDAEVNRILDEAE